jgi:hypothetical protein
MRITSIWFVLWATLSGCEPAREQQQQSAPPVREAAATPAPQSRFYPTEMLWKLPPAAADSALRARERAKGVVVPKYTSGPPDELVVLNDTAHEVQTVARVRFYKQPEGGWRDTVWTRERGLHAEIMRVTHDDYGLPVVSLHGSWLRVHYAYGADGTPRSGWVRLIPGMTFYHDWDQQMFEFSTRLAQDGDTELYRAPNGSKVDPGLARNYTMQVLKAESAWIQVVLMRPDTSACTGNEQLTVQRRDTVWVRRFNEQGTRQLQSAFAGC